MSEHEITLNLKNDYGEGKREDKATINLKHQTCGEKIYEKITNKQTKIKTTKLINYENRKQKKKKKEKKTAT